MTLEELYPGGILGDLEETDEEMGAWDQDSKKVYVVTYGLYDENHIVGIFTDAEKARELMAYYEREPHILCCEIEEYELNPILPNIQMCDCEGGKAE